MRAVVATTRYALASVAGGATCFCGFPGFDSSARAATSGQKHLPCPRYNVPLQRRYKGTSAERSRRAKMLMFDWLLARADLPFLDETDQRHVIHRLLVLLVRSMHKRKSAVGALTELETHTLVLDVFVKGTIDIFQDPAQRRALVERIEFYVSSVPFFPTPLLEHLIVWWCEKATAVVTPVLVETYNEHLCRVDIYAEVALCSGAAAEPRRQALHGAPPREPHARVHEAQKHGRDRNVSLVTLALSLLPEKTAADLALLFVDSFLESLKTDKLEQIMYNIVLNDVLQQGLINQPLFISKCYDKDKRDDNAASNGGRSSVFQGRDGPAKHHHRHRGGGCA
ncbi:ATPase [Aureococcus anophagefferens]|nr:ATPase [Aureococcus anophagefferens]